MRWGISKQLTVLVMLGSCSAAFARDTYLVAWQSIYPTSTLPSRMAAMTGSSCYTCHDPSGFASPGNCYREDIFSLLSAGRTIDQAINELDSADSDGDGVPNGEEATAIRDDLPGDVGYNMGLVGPSGTNPCGSNPIAIVTGVAETPPPVVPAASWWGVVVASVLLLTVGSTAANRGKTQPEAVRRDA